MTQSLAATSSAIRELKAPVDSFDDPLYDAKAPDREPMVVSG